MDSITIITIVIGILLLIMLFIGLFRMITVNEIPSRLIPTSISSLSDKFQTGDIVFFTHGAIGDALLRLLTASQWLHAGIIVRDVDQKLYVMEMGTYDRKEWKFLLTPFEKWLKDNRKYHIGYIKYEGPPISLDSIVSIYHEFKNVKLSRPGLSWLRFATKKPYRQEDLAARSFTCCEIVVMVLQKLNIITKEYSCCSYFPGDIARLDFNTEPGTRYHPMVRLKIKK